MEIHKPSKYDKIWHCMMTLHELNELYDKREWDSKQTTQ